MSETMIIKLAELTRVVWAVAYVSLTDRRLTVWNNGTPLLWVELNPFVTDAEAQAEAEAELRKAGYSVASDWTRPSDEWTEFRAEVMGTEPVAEVPAGWATIEA